MEDVKEIEIPPLGRYELRDLAQQFILGPELIAEIERLESEGVVFYEDPDDHQGPYPARVRVLLLADEDETDPSEAGWGVVSQRAEALAAARKDKDFLRARLADLHHWRAAEERHGRVEEHTYVSQWDSGLLFALSRQLGYNQNYQGYYTSEEGRDEYRTVKYLLGHDFEERLLKQAPSWLEPLRSKDEYLRGEARKHLGDPAGPEQVAMRLITRRLEHLTREVDRTLLAERRAHKQEVERQAAEEAERQVDDAWSGFFAGDDLGEADTAAAPELAPLPAPPRELPVAPSLSEDAGDIGR